MKTISITVPDEVKNLLIEGIILKDFDSSMQQFYAHLHSIEDNNKYIILPQNERFGPAKVIISND